MTDEQKIFIRGVEGRGSEVIKMLEDLGGKVPPLDLGGNPRYIYFISHDGDITCALYDSEAGKIIMDFYHELHLPEQWKDGDILVDDDNPNRFIVKSNAWDGGWKNNFKAYLFVNPKSIQESPIAIFCGAEYHKADSEEIRRFHKFLHMHGKDWVAENKQLVDYVTRWKPDKDDEYYYVDNDGEVESETWDGVDQDIDCYNFGNCFRSYNQAEQARKKLRETLMSCHRNDDADE